MEQHARYGSGFPSEVIGRPNHFVRLECTVERSGRQAESEKRSLGDLEDGEMGNSVTVARVTLNHLV